MVGGGGGRLSAGVWEASAGRDVPTDNNTLPVNSTVVAQQQDDADHPPIKLHELTDPRPLARLVYKTWVGPDDNAAAGIFSDPSYDARGTVMLPSDPAVALPPQRPGDGSAQVSEFKPESITVQTTSSAQAILSVSLVNYPGWEASVDGQPAPLLRADLAFSAVPVPAGTHTVQFSFRPTSYVIGRAISIAAVALPAIRAAFSL